MHMQNAGSYLHLTSYTGCCRKKYCCEEQGLNKMESKNVKRRRREEQQLPFTAYEMLTGIMGKASAT